jgi:hypothetical protein
LRSHPSMVATVRNPVPERGYPGISATSLALEASAILSR